MSSAPPPSGPEERRPAAPQRARVAQSARAADLEELAELAGRLLDAPYAAVTFLDARRPGARAVAGRPVGGVRRGRALVDLAVAADDGVVDVPLTAGGSLSAGPLADRDPPLRRVAAAALPAPDGQRIGAVEVGWERDRVLTGDEKAMLRRMAEHASRVLALRADATDYRRFVDLNPDAVVVLDLEGAIELANQAMAELVGAVDAASLVGTSFLDLVVASDRGRVAGELVEVLLARRRSARLDLGLRRADAAVLPCAVTAGNLLGGRRSLQLVIRDLTERLRAEEERARLSEQLAQAQRLDVAGRLASGLAHDLNNLLTVMGVSLELVDEGLQGLGDAPRVGEIAHDLRQVVGAVGRAEQMTAKLLQFAGQRPVGLEPVALPDVISTVETLVRPTLGPETALSVEVEAGLPVVVADRTQLEQALVNLIINARDAIGARPEPTEAATISVRARRITGSREGAGRGARRPELRESVCIQVADDGVGMDDETLARAFEPLFTTKPAGEGTGLGLPTVLAFVQQLGGRVDVDARPGWGTTVTLTFPTAESVEAGPGADGGATGPVCVLLVDPADAPRRVIASMLRAAGHQVRAVATSDEAEGLLAEGSVDLLVTDAAVPGGSGWRLIETARRRVPALPALVFATSPASPHLAGVRTLVKPFSNERLVQAVTELLDARS